MLAEKLKTGDEIRVIAPSRNLTIIYPKAHKYAVDFWQKEGFNLIFSKNCRENGKFDSSSIKSRVDDIHEAFSDPNVKMIITCVGGFNSNQLLPYLDFDLIARNPKSFCGYSDITALHNAIYAKTGLVTYYGPHYMSFAFKGEQDYTRNTFFECITNNSPINIKPSESAKEYYVIQEGSCEGTIIGGNLCTLNLLQGTPYMPDIRNKVLFLEDDNIVGEYFCQEFQRNLCSLLQVEGADTIKGIVLGRFDKSCNMSVDTVKDIIKDIAPANIPIIFGADFGHVFPIFTFPIGGTVKITAEKNNAKIQIIDH